MKTSHTCTLIIGSNYLFYIYMQNEIVVRPASMSDIDALASLFDGYRVFYKQESDVEKAHLFLSQRLQNKDSYILLAEHQGKAVGFTQLYPLFSSVSMQRLDLLNDLYVVPSMRGHGIGEQLLAKAKEYAISVGSKGLSLETGKDNPAQKLYERLDWKLDTDYLHYFWKST